MTDHTASCPRPLPKQKRPSHASVVFDGVLFQVWQWEQGLYDGRTATFEALSRPDTVLVLPVENGSVILIEERQPGMETMCRCLGGRVERGESPVEAARRELLEESGARADDFLLWDAWQPVNKIDWAVFLFVAHGLQWDNLRSLDSGERVSVRTLPIADLLDPTIPLALDDYELAHKLYRARSEVAEREKLLTLLRAGGD